MRKKSGLLKAICVSAVLAGCMFGMAIAAAAATEGSLRPKAPSEDPSTDYGWFEQFRAAQFAPGTEPLIEQALGGRLEFDAQADWLYPSYYSAAVGFAVSLPAVTVVEYGPTADYGSATDTQDAYYYNHLHYLTDLAPGRSYHYRLLAQTEDGKWLASEDREFSTAALGGDVIRIPEDMPGGAPYILDSPGKTYLLTQDMTLDASFAKIVASNVTLDLGGHTVVYDNGEPIAEVQPEIPPYYQDGATFGVRAAAWNLSGISIYNGAIVQGAHGGGGGYNPINLYMLNSTRQGSEIAGVSIDYHGYDVGGFDAVYVWKLHHNVAVDRGTGIGNRHAGIKAMSGMVEEVSHNSFRRFRHQGVVGGRNVIGNEFYGDSYDTNSYMILQEAGGEVAGNKLFGVGNMPIGIGYNTNSWIHDNLIYMHGTANRLRSLEYGEDSGLSGISGIRLTIYNHATGDYDAVNGDPIENLRYENNLIVLKPWEGCGTARGLWLSTGPRSVNTVFKNNIVKVEALSDNLNRYDHRFGMNVTCVDTNGTHPPEGMAFPVTLFEGNTFISNVQFISFGAYYGSGIHNALFKNTRLVKINHHNENYEPFTVSYWDYGSTENHMVDTTVDGVDLSAAPVFYGYPFCEMDLGSTYGLRFVDASGNPIANARISANVAGDWSYGPHYFYDMPSGANPQPANTEYAVALLTDSQGRAQAEFMEIYHFVRELGIQERVDYAAATFSAPGYKDAELDLAALKADGTVILHSAEELEPEPEASLGLPLWTWFRGASTTSAVLEFSDYHDGMEFFRADSIDGNYAYIGSATASERQYVDSGLVPGKTYYYKGRLYQNDGSLGVMTAPTAVAAELPMVTWSWIRGGGPAGAKVYVSWNSWQDVDHANLYRSEAADGEYALVAAVEMNADFSADAPPDVPDGGVWYYRLQAVKNGVGGEFTEPVAIPAAA